MTKYVFVLGSAGELAWTEINSLFPQAVRNTPKTAVLISNQVLKSIQFERLGGVIKAGQILNLPEVTPEAIYGYIKNEVTKKDFGISLVDFQNFNLSEFSRDIKKLAESENLHLRYILPKSDQILSSVQADPSKVTEFLIFPYADKPVVAKIDFVQDYRNWANRDFQRPDLDSRRGMLPPKVARMILNISGITGTDDILYDPYCGMGTILAEGMMMGAKRVIGSDQSADAVASATRNLNWIKSKYELSSEFDLFQADATHIADNWNYGEVSLIVTEPYMGSRMIGLSKYDKDKLKNIAKGLDKLYIGSLREWYRILKNGGKVMIAVPRFYTGNSVITVKKVIDTCEKLGYTKLLGPIEYSHFGAVVRREFYLFSKRS